MFAKYIIYQCFFLLYANFLYAGGLSLDNLLLHLEPVLALYMYLMSHLK